MKREIEKAVLLWLIAIAAWIFFCLDCPGDAPTIFGGDLTGDFTYPVYLRWDPSAGTNFSGYIVYSGVQSRVYTNLFAVLMATNAGVMLDYDTNYFFAVTAVNSLGIESAYSNEVTYRRYHWDRITLTWPTNQPATLLVSTHMSLSRSAWIPVPVSTPGTVTILRTPNTFFFCLQGTTNAITIVPWNPLN